MAGIGSWLTRGAQVATQTGVAGFRFLATVGVQTLKMAGKAGIFASIDLVLTQLLDNLRDYCVSLCKESIIENVPKVIAEKYSKLEAAMDSIYENSYERAQPKKMIQESMSSTLVEEKQGVVGSAIYMRCSQIASNLSGTLGSAAEKVGSGASASILKGKYLRGFLIYFLLKTNFI